MNILDKVIGAVNPKAGLKRVQARAQMLAFDSQVRRYEGAAAGRRHEGWLAKSNPSVNQLIQKDHKQLVSRSRELSINNPYARKAPYAVANSVVGTGIIGTPVIVDKIEKGQIIPTPNKDKILEAAKLAWQQFAESVTCDYNGDNSFYGLQHLAERTIVISGEVLALRKRVKEDVNKYGIQILLLEGDYIDTSKNTDKDPDGGYTFYGVKYDSDYKKTGYWIFDRHPSEALAKSTLVPIKDVLHSYDIERTGQIRGVPSASSSILKQRDLDDYEDAELMGKKTSACFAGFRQKVADPEGNPNTVGEAIEDITPGQIYELDPGETMTFASPPQNPGYNEYVKTQMRAISAGYLMPYETLTGDLSNVNFSSGRMGWIEYQRQVDYWQYLMFIPRFCDKIFSWFAEGFKISQSLDKDLEIKASWTAPRREMIDPVKETGAKRMAMRAGLTSWQEMVRQDGYNPADVLKELIEDQQLFIDAGLMPDFTQFFELQAKVKMNAGKENNTSKE